MLNALRELAERDRQSPVLAAFAESVETDPLSMLTAGVTKARSLIELLFAFAKEPSSVALLEATMNALTPLAEFDYGGEESVRGAVAELFGAASDVKIAELKLSMAKRLAREKGQAL